MGNSDHGTTYMREGGDDGELRPWHYMYVYSIDSRMETQTEHPPRATWKPLPETRSNSVAIASARTLPPSFSLSLALAVYIG